MYDFRTLSPIDFENLARDLLQAELGFRLESFGPGPDQGIDFRYATAAGDIIVQAKHYSEGGSKALIRAAKHEDVKVRRLTPARYILVTSVSLTPGIKQTIRATMASTPLALSDIFGREDINNLLGKHPRVERNHFKLWLSSAAVLERILHSGVYNRTLAEMEAIREIVPQYVYNASFPAAESVLQRHGALIIAGEPGVGKTTLARVLLWLHAEQGWNVYVIDDIKQAFEVSYQCEKVIIFFDDFLGQIKLSGDLIREIDQRFPPFLRRVRSNRDVRFVVTTRDYILHQAQAESQRLSSAEINASEFILDIGHYTRSIKAQILYNHLYFSDIAQEQLDALLSNNFFLEIIDHDNFSPRLIELITSANYLLLTSGPLKSVVRSILNNPRELWEKPYRAHISTEARVLMLTLYFYGGRASLDELGSKPINFGAQAKQS